MWYRFYEMDENDHVLKAATLEFFNDAEALAAAEERAARHGVEVWQASRRVGGVKPRRPEPPSAQSLLT
jgi:hypothetical protein